MTSYRAFGVVLCWICLSCGDSPSGPAVPPPGPNWSVLPIPLDKLARITPIGHNNKPLPNKGTYWNTCDGQWLFPSPRPCVLERLPVRAPGDGVVMDVQHVDDGIVVIEGPPGLYLTIGHVTPATGLRRGDRVSAGEIVATMFYTHSVDLTVYNNGVTPHAFVNPARMPPPYLYAQNAIEQFPEPMRSQLISRVGTASDPIGRLSWDRAGTAAGAWFLEGTPVERSMEAVFFKNQLFLGRLAERETSRILTVGERWAGLESDLLVVDPAAPSWNTITPANGVVALKLWRLGRDGLPAFDFPHGTLLVQVLPGERIRVEWFDHHDAVTSFTAAARIYER